MYDVNDDVIQEIYYGVKLKVFFIQVGNYIDLVNFSINVLGLKVGGEEQKGVKIILNIVIFILKIYFFLKGQMVVFMFSCINFFIKMSFV